MPKIPRQSWPSELLRSHAVKGVFVGGCVARGDGSSFRAKAHAHIKGEFTGWLCFRRADRLHESMLVIHELAHLVSMNGHTALWRKTVLALGGTLGAIPGLLRSYYPLTRQLPVNGTESRGGLIGGRETDDTYCPD